MTTEKSIAEISYSKSDWEGLQIRLHRIYQGRPLHAVQFIPLHRTYPVAIWKILSGNAEVNDGDIHCHAKSGEWMVCLPGKRNQIFNESARIFAIHLVVESYGNSLGWKGPHLLGLGKDRQLDCISDALWKVAKKWNLCRDRYLFDDKIILPLKGHLEVQQHISVLMQRLVILLARQGVSYEPTASRDIRVNEGLQWLSGQPLRKAFSRNDLAKMSGLSASRLDRVWRKEIGMTPYQFWEYRRLKHASHHLRNPDRSVKEIAFDLGFRHVSQFSTWFRTHQEESPSEFRSNPEYA